MTFGKNGRVTSQIAIRRRPRQSRSVMTVDAILEAAKTLFARDGFEVTSTTRIADAAGVSIGTLYEYFTSKEALVAKLIKCHCEHLMDLYGKAFQVVEGKGIDALVDVLVDTSANAYAENVALQRVLLEQMGRVSRLRHLKRVSLALTDLIEQALNVCGEPVTRPNIHLAAFVLESTVEALIHRSITYTVELFGYELRRELKIMLALYLRAPVPDSAISAARKS